MREIAIEGQGKGISVRGKQMKGPQSLVNPDVQKATRRKFMGEISELQGKVLEVKFGRQSWRKRM